jgi:hypothetical protein
MPAPIAIARSPSHLDSFGALKPGSFATPNSASFREAMAFSTGKEIAE